MNSKMPNHSCRVRKNCSESTNGNDTISWFCLRHFRVSESIHRLFYNVFHFDSDGGMENPCMNFLTPTLLAGDRSLISTIVHEMTHSWTGQ